MAHTLGIGIITYNRKETLLRTIKAIFQYTHQSFEFIIADDGSTDGTQEALQELNIPFVTGRNKGISWNRNRALWFLKEEKNCNHIILLEDDCSPNEFGWDKEWSHAIENFGHINYMPELTLQIDNDISSGSGTASDPFIAPMHQALCVGYHAKALSYVGYLDIRFQKYGEEHVEHTHRFLRASYGGLHQFLTPERGQVFYLRGGLSVLPSESHGDHNIAMLNRQIHENIQTDPIFRAPWRDDKQMFEFREEINAALSRPTPEIQSKNNTFDEIISLGGDEYTNLFIKEHFGNEGSKLFDGFITPFHTLIKLLETNFRDLFCTQCLYSYHNALRCRETLLIYHNCLPEKPQRLGAVEHFHSQLTNLIPYYQTLIHDLDKKCDGSRRILFIRNWKETLHYQGTHRPEHTPSAHFRNLKKALMQRYPRLTFKILFVNFGSATDIDDDMIFANIEAPDTAPYEQQQVAWKKMFSHLNIHLVL